MVSNIYITIQFFNTYGINLNFEGPESSPPETGEIGGGAHGASQQGETAC